ncbi:hypothetical protein KL940_005424, partial [Ogataea angusta]
MVSTDKPRRLSHVQFFDKIAIEKSSGDIHLVNRERVRGSKRKKKTKTVVSNERTERLIVVNTMDLTETLSYQSCLMRKGGCRRFHSVNPATANSTA